MIMKQRDIMCINLLSNWSHAHKEMSFFNSGAEMFKCDMNVTGYPTVGEV